MFFFFFFICPVLYYTSSLDQNIVLIQHRVVHINCVLAFTSLERIIYYVSICFSIYPGLARLDIGK